MLHVILLSDEAVERVVGASLVVWVVNHAPDYVPLQGTAGHYVCFVERTHAYVFRRPEMIKLRKAFGEKLLEDLHC